MKMEMLILPRDNVNESLTAEEKKSGLYKRGDIVVIRPKGWLWGTKEVTDFIIVECEMTPQESVCCCEALAIEGHRRAVAPGATENMIDQLSTVLRRRRHYVDLDALLDKALVPLSGLTREVAESRMSARGDEFQPARDYSLPHSDIIDRLDDPEIAELHERIRQDQIMRGYTSATPPASDAVRLAGRRQVR